MTHTADTMSASVHAWDVMVDLGTDNVYTAKHVCVCVCRQC